MDYPFLSTVKLCSNVNGGIIIKEMCTITHNNYAKISDIVLWLNNEYILKFNVELYTTRQDRNGRKQRENFHKEIGYNNPDGKFSVNIQRAFKYYLSIDEARKSGSTKFTMPISMQDTYFLLNKLDKILNEWFIGDAVNRTFSKIDGAIKPILKESVTANFVYGNYIEFEPATSMNTNGDQIIGCKLFLNQDGISTFVPVNTIIVLRHFLTTFNMYQAAQNMLNYIGRPENGSNMLDISDAGSEESIPKGFFDRVNMNKKQ